MKIYSFGNTNAPTIMLLPGTCCYWKSNFEKVIHAAYGCSLGGKTSDKSVLFRSGNTITRRY